MKPLLQWLGCFSIVWVTQASAQGPVTSGDGVIATVNGEAVYVEDLERLLGDLHGDAAGGERRAPDLDRAVFRLVNDKLLTQEGRALGLEQEEPIPGLLAARREEMAVKELERVEIWSRAVPTDAEMKAAFDSEYRTITFRILTVRGETEAQRLFEELAAGADFEALVAEHSIDPYSARGGLLEDVDKTDIPQELASDAFAMSPGEINGPLLTRLGWSILQLQSIDAADPERFEGLKRPLFDRVRFNKAEASRAHLAARIRETVDVDIDAAVLSAIVPERLPDGRLKPRVDEPTAVVATVGDRVIEAEAFGRALRARWSGVANEIAAKAATPIVLERMIRERMTQVEAMSRGLGETPEVLRALSAYETQLLAARVLRDIVAPSADEVTREEMRLYYEENSEAFRRPPRLHLGQITAPTREEAERLADLLRQGTDLAWLARQHSTDRYRDAGGDRGWITLGAEKGLFGQELPVAQAGDVLGPTPAGDGFVLARVNAREEQGTYAFDEVSGNIRKILEKWKATKAIHDFIEVARSRSEIVFHDEAIAKLRIMGSQAPQVESPAGHPQ